MRRGFKTEAEQVAVALRHAMHLRNDAPTDIFAVAAHRGIEVRSARDLTSIDRLVRLEELQPGSFSACTFTIDGRQVIVYSPLASAARTQSDVAHELAHVLLGHAVTEAQQVGDLTFFTCNPEEEQEANWLAGCLLLPRSLLVWAARQGMGASAIAEYCGVSEQMAAFRLRATGVLRQMVARAPTTA